VLHANEAGGTSISYHESKSGGAVRLAAKVRRPLDPVDDVLFVVELGEVKQQVRVVGVVDQCDSRLVGTDFQVVDDVGDELEHVGEAFTSNTSGHVQSDHQVHTTAAG